MAHNYHRAASEASRSLDSLAGAPNPQGGKTSQSGAHRIVVHPPQTSFIDDEWEQQPLPPTIDENEKLKALGRTHERPETTRSPQTGARLPFATDTTESSVARVTVRPPQTTFIDEEWEAEPAARTPAESEIREILGRTPRPSRSLGKRIGLLIALLGSVALGLVLTSHFSTARRVSVRHVARHHVVRPPYAHLIPIERETAHYPERLKPSDEVPPETASTDAPASVPSATSTSDAPKPVAKRAVFKPRRAKPAVVQPSPLSDDSVDPSANPSALQPTIPDPPSSTAVTESNSPPPTDPAPSRTLERSPESP